jgi:predicted hotdog family 3-hydroxylacyl-ACP dehydratase
LSLPLPHQEPFRFVGQADAVYDDAAQFRWTLPRGGDTYGLRIHPQLLCAEALAQAAAAFHGLTAAGGEPEVGTLASLDSFTFTGHPNPGDTLVLKIRKTKAMGPLVLFDGEVWVHHRMVAQGKVTVKRGAP